jgi:hypothetical protein
MTDKREEKAVVQEVDRAELAQVDGGDGGDLLARAQALLAQYPPLYCQGWNWPHWDGGIPPR